MKGNTYKKVGNSDWYTDDGTSRSETNTFISSVYSENSSTGKKKSKQHKKKKCDHKHVYEDVLLKVTTKDPLTGKVRKTLHLGKKCSVCNLIKETGWFILGEDGKILSYDEVLKKYPNYDIVDYC